jgi:hypothetical protein
VIFALKHTIYHIHYRSLQLLEAISKENNHKTLLALKNGLENLCFALSNNDSNDALQFRETAVTLHAQIPLLLKRQPRKLLTSICIALVCLAQKQEHLLDITYLQKFQQKIEPLENESHRFETSVLRLLSQQCSLFISGHKGICDIAVREWLSGSFMTDNVTFSGSNFIEKVELNKQELCYLYALEKEKKKSELIFSLVAGLHRLTHGGMMLALLDELSNNKPSCFFITLVHFRSRLFHSIGCKHAPERIQWFDSDCGIFESYNKKAFASWLDFYLEKNKYKEKFSFFTVHVGERSRTLESTIQNITSYASHFIG